MGLSLIACFPVYVAPTRASLAKLLSSAVLAAITLAGCLLLEFRYAFGIFSFPPPGLLVALALVALASAVVSRAILARSWSPGRIR